MIQFRILVNCIHLKPEITNTEPTNLHIVCTELNLSSSNLSSSKSLRNACFCKNTISMHLIYRLAAVQRLLRCFVIQWRVLCFMLDSNPLSIFGIERDMVRVGCGLDSKRVLKIRETEWLVFSCCFIYTDIYVLGMFSDDLCLSSLQHQCLVLLSRINNNSLHFREN